MKFAEFKSPKVFNELLKKYKSNINKTHVYHFARKTIRKKEKFHTFPLPMSYTALKFKVPQNCTIMLKFWTYHLFVYWNKMEEKGREIQISKSAKQDLCKGFHTTRQTNFQEVQGAQRRLGIKFQWSVDSVVVASYDVKK